MKNFIKLKSIIILLFITVPLIGQTTITYQGTDEIIFNPERGFSAYRDLPITSSYINLIKNDKISVIQRIYTIPQYRNTPLPESFLNTVRNDLNTARNGGVKVVMRFSYTNNQNGADAALDTILLHINQLSPILQENYDVIAYMEAGFIGAWGEWYYSSHNLNNTVARRTVLFALLDALPVNRDVAVRTPDYKRKIFNNYVPLDFADAFNGTKRARTGAHNDCFLADETDGGTYLWNNIEGDKNYLNLDNRFVPQGGETCQNSIYCSCDTALVNLKRMHWSVLNKDYNIEVLNRWVNEGCMDEIKRRLGYRFELLEATMPNAIKPGGIFYLNFKITNKGFASPYNPRNLEIILRNVIDKQRYRLLTNEDPRFWLSGDTITVSIIGGIPQNMPEGNYNAYIFLADPAPTLHNKPDYAIRLANYNLWEDSTGYNKLNHSVEINRNQEGENYTGNLFFEPIDNPISVEKEEKIHPISAKINIYPNPFNGFVKIKIDIKPQEIKSVQIFNVIGELVKDFNYSDYQDGQIIWNARDNDFNELNSGVYILFINTDKTSFANKLIYLK
ncbi:MAG: T9SS type A sorting domain-containing protein [Ignavibacterium sp.]|uniref:T9SS type A sorting domain-containing protein n=1 Tax=Ignavibacterium sp. TaxID=2651167 RepID=UPI0040495607